MHSIMALTNTYLAEAAQNPVWSKKPNALQLAAQYVHRVGDDVTSVQPSY
jgi:hypothetical protein